MLSRALRCLQQAATVIRVPGSREVEKEEDGAVQEDHRFLFKSRKTQLFAVVG